MSDYLVILEPSTTGWGAWSPDLGVYATGENREATIEQARDAIAFHLEGLREMGLPIPEPHTSTVTVSA
jgi:predicted RNase H-like HicB family nuclease